jgi:hypothetical protein
MPDFLPDILPHLNSHRLSGLDLGGDFLHPSYAGYSLLNLPGTVCHLLRVPQFGAPPLSSELLSALGNDYRHVILIVADGLGLDRFQRVLEQMEPSIWSQRYQEAVFAPLTTVVPSTTSAALTTLWTGASPGAHGIIGYEVWLKEYGLVANMITHSAMSYFGDAGGLGRSGFKPETFLPVPTLGPHLARHGVTSRAFMHQSIARSGLSAMHLPEVQVTAFRNVADLWISLRDAIHQKSEEHSYNYVYWSDVDELSHRFGPEDVRIDVEFSSFSRVFESEFLRPLASRSQQDTLVILVADHGLIHTPRNPLFELRNHLSFVRMLHMLPSGENRLPYLFIRPGMAAAVHEYIDKTWPGMFSILTAHQVLESGLLGPQPYSGVLLDRLGDLVLVPHGDAFLWWADRESTMLGRHGGLSAQEMLVPFFAFKA